MGQWAWIDFGATWRGLLGKLLPILAGLRALLPEDAETVTRAEWCRILSTLRCAESIARRIIVIAARGIVVDPPAKRKASGKKAAGDRAAEKDEGEGEEEAPAFPAFPLFDRRKRLGPPPEKKTRRKRGRGPGVYGFDGYDLPRPPEPAEPSPDDVLDASRLQQRLASIADAMNNVEREALRLAKTLARGNTRYDTPMRVGRPPGHRERKLTVEGHYRRGWRAVDELLYDAHQFAWAAVREPPS